MKKEHWHYQIDIVIFCKELNILNADLAFLLQLPSEIPLPSHAILLMFGCLST